MSLLTANNLSKFFGADEIFSGISLEIPPRARIALVGPNGAGKTTLIQLLLGHDIPTDGTIHRAKGLRMGFLPQRPELAGTHNVWQEQERAFEQVRQMEAELEALSAKLADPEEGEAALERYGHLQQEYEHLGGFDYPTRIKMVLTGVGFREDEWQKPLPLLSGGQRTRALLARLLLEAPDLLILDEPTNHLDIQAVEWLEDFLKDFPGGVLAVSHDRYFIDHFASHVWELDFGRLETYRGNYSHYAQQREERRERLQKEYEAQQEFLAKEMDFIRRYMDSQKTAQARGRLRRLETMKKRGTIIERGPRQRKTMRLQMQTANRSGDKVIMTRGLKLGYPEDEFDLFEAPDLTLWRGETAAIIGPNGAGKSTLLKTLIGQLAPRGGEARIGASVQIGYFAQAHEELNPRNSIVDEINTVKTLRLPEARNYLGAFLFHGDDVFRTIDTLSGGERGRVALAKLALSGANLLLLDEPTNHLDIESQEILQEVLESFSGTILLVSHDRYLIDALATQIWAVGSGQMEVFEGSYAEYVAARNQRQMLSTEKARAAAQPSAPAPAVPRKNGLNPYALKKRIEELEAQIHALEGQVSELNDAIASASAAGDAARVRALGERYTAAEADLNAALDEWTELAG